MNHPEHLRSFPKPHGLLVVIIASVLMFLFLNQVSPAFNPSLSSPRLTFLVLFIIYIFKSSRFVPPVKAPDLIFISAVLFLILYSVLTSMIFNADFIQSSRFFHFLIISVLGSIFWRSVFDDGLTFHKAVVFAALIQSAFVIFSYSSVSFQSFIHSIVFSPDEGITRARSSGLSSSGGAALSVVIALGAISLFRLTQIQGKSWHFVAMISICMSSALVGRTGMLIALGFAVLIILRGNLRFSRVLGGILFLIPFLMAVVSFLKTNEQFMSYTVVWALSVFSGSDQTLQALATQDLAQFTSRVAVVGGEGISLPSGSNASGSDVGYIQTAYAIGLPLTILFYSSFLLYLCTIRVPSKSLFFKLLLLVLVFVIEIKEPFIFKYAISFYVICSLLYERSCVLLHASKTCVDLRV